MLCFLFVLSLYSNILDFVKQSSFSPIHICFVGICHIISQTKYFIYFYPDILLLS